MIVGMRRHSGRGLGFSFALVSVLALLSLACLPTLALATDAPGIEYEEAPPRAEGGSGGHSGSGGGANASNTPPGSGHSGKSGSSGEGSSAQGGHAGANTGGTNGGTGQSSPGGGSGDKAKAPPQSTAQAPQGTSGSQAGGSSPLVPILVAIFALAAISVGAVVWRQRRQRGEGPGSSVSPEAS